MSTFETLTRDLATRFDLGNQATPFLRMLMAHMNKDRCITGSTPDARSWPMRSNRPRR